LDVESAALRAPQVGVANTNPQHILSVGSNLYVSGDSSDVLTVDGNVVCEGVKVGLIEITPSYDLAAVANVGNVTSNTIQFTNPDTGIVATGNVTVGKTLTVEGFRITAQAASADTLQSITTDDPAEGKTDSGVTSNPIHITNDRDSESPYSGALQIGTNTGNNGGLGVAGNVHVGRGLFVDTDTLVVDSTNNRVGIGKTNPDATLDVDGDAIIRGDLSVLGTTTTIDTENLRVQDPIIELGKDNAGTGDLGLVMTRPTGSSNVAIIFDENADTLEIGYTNGGASDTTITMVSTPLSVNINGDLSITSNLEVSGNINGDLSVTSNLEVGTANLFVDTVNSRVGIGTTEPDATLDVRGSGQYEGIYSKRIWVANIGDNSGDGSPADDNTGSPWRGLGFDNLAWNNQSHKYSADIPILSGYNGVALRSGAGNLVLTQAGDVGIGTTDPTATLDIYKEDTTAAGQTVISSITGVFSGSDATGGNINNKGLYINLDSSATGGGTSSNNPAEEHRVWGIDVDIDVTGDSDDIRGGRFLVRSELAENGSDRNTSIYGMDAQGQQNGSAPSTNVTGVRGRSLKGGDSTGLADKMIAVDAEYEINAGTCTDAYGVRVQFDRNGGAATSSYLFYGAHAGSTTTITNNYGLYVSGADKHYLEGNVGIGITEPTDLLDVHYPNPSYGSFAGTEEGSLTVSAGAEHSNAAVYFRTPFDAAAPAKRAIFSDGGSFSGGGNGGLHFCLERTADNTTKVDLTDSKMTILHNGNVGIGTTNPQVDLEIENVNGSPELRFTDPFSGADAAWDARSNVLGEISWYSRDSQFTNSYAKVASITSKHFDDGFPDGALCFTTSANGVLNEDAMVIDHDGVVLMNVSERPGNINGVLQIVSSSDLYLADAIACYPYSVANHIINFLDTNHSGIRGKIVGVNNTTVAYNTTSDERLKKQIKPMQSTLDRVKALKPSTYTWIRDEAEGYGFIAQEVFKVFPEMRPVVSYSGCTCKWGGRICESCTLCEDEHDYPKNKDGTDYHYGLDYGLFTPFLTKAIQELDAKVEEHHNRKSLVTDVDYSTIGDYEGLIVSATTNDYKNGRPVLSLSNTGNDKTCYGVILGKAESIDNETNIQKSGDGRMWVINTHGNLESGDLVTTSGIGGYGKKQEDDILRSYTVAKLTQDCDFTEKLVPIKRIKQELKDVTYYIRDNYIKITNLEKVKELNAIEREVSVYITNKVVDGDSGDYDRREFIPEISEEEYDALTSKEQEVYEVKYIKNGVTTITPYEYNRLTDAEKSVYKEATEIGYYIIEKHESSKPMPECCGEYTTDIRQELVNVLDDNGQLVWEESEEMETIYKIRYLDADGNITDEANHVYKAAFVGCTYHCG